MELEQYNRQITGSRYNGRVSIIENPDPKAVFRMQERIALKNKSTSYESALAGNDWEENILSSVFFSKENIQIIQNGLRAGVYKMSKNKFVIPPQNIDQLKIVMRSMYLQYAEHLPDNITNQVERLNKLVWDYVVPSVYNEAVGYTKYMQDTSSLVMPMDRPIQNDREYKQLELKSWF
jgi:phosphopantetheine adenylyltransferase